MSLGPGLVAGGLLVLIATQITRLLAPGQGPYLWTLVLALIGFLVGETLASAGRGGGPTLGSLHPLQDLGTIAVLELLGALVLVPLRRTRGPR